MKSQTFEALTHRCPWFLSPFPEGFPYQTKQGCLQCASVRLIQDFCNLINLLHTFYFRESCVGKTKFIATSLGPFIHALAQFASTRAARYPTSGFKSSLSSATLNRFSVPKTWKMWKMHPEPEPTETYSSVKSVFPNVDCQTASSVFSLHTPACAMHVLRQAADAQLAFHPWHEEKAQAQELNANVGKIVIHQPCLSSDSCFAYRSWSQHDEEDEPGWT